MADNFNLSNISEMLKKLGITASTDLTELSGRKAEKEMVDHLFWKTQPVPSKDEDVTEVGPIETKTVADVSKEAYELPEGYEWTSLNLLDDVECNELYDLLTNNYVEDDDAHFRFDYRSDFLRWALTPPGYVVDWHVGIRKVSNKQLVGFISGIPIDLRVHNEPVKSVEINFLCVHKQLRSKRFAPLLIQEVTRRVNLRDIWQAAYTAGIVIPKPVSSATYFHRSLNPKKLVDVRFSYKPANKTFADLQKIYQLPVNVEVAALRPLELKDVPQASKLLNDYLATTKITQYFTEEEFAHYFIPRKGIVYAYVIEDAVGNITDMCSFYSLPSSIFGFPKYKTLEVAYSFYNVCTSVSFTKLMKQALIIAKNNKFDVFNALGLMQNKECFQELKFAEGDGNLNYYLYNYRMPEFDPKDIGLVFM